MNDDDNYSFSGELLREPSQVVVVPVWVAGVRFLPLDYAQAVSWILVRARDVLDGRSEGVAVHLLNAFSLSLANRNDGYGALLNSSTSCNFADGKPISWVSSVRRDPRKVTQVRGPSLFNKVLDSSQDTDVTHYLVGGSPETLQKLLNRIAERYPRAKIAGFVSPPFREMTAVERAELCETIRLSHASIVWIGLGTPKQDTEADHIARETGKVAVAIGAAFDFTAGAKREAPPWMTSVGLEWGFRLGTEPRRLWRRYTTGNAQFASAVARKWSSDKKNSKAGSLLGTSVDTENTTPTRIPYICWVRHHGRSEDVARVFGWELEYIYPESRPAKFELLSRYIRSITSSRTATRGAKTVVLMAPPPFILLVRRRHQRVIIDLHSGLITDKRWRPFLAIFCRALRPRDIVLAHNHIDSEWIAGNTSAEVALLQDPILSANALRYEGKDADAKSPVVVFPSSGDTDEPIALVDRVFNRLNTPADPWEYIITGGAARRLLENTRTTTPGYLPQSEYDALIANSAVVVAISTRPNIVQRAAFEAIAAGARPVVAESLALREILGNAAEYVDANDEYSLLKGISRACSRGALSESDKAILHVSVRAREKSQIAELSGLMNRGY